MYGNYDNYGGIWWCIYGFSDLINFVYGSGYRYQTFGNCAKLFIPVENVLYATKITTLACVQ